MKSLIEIGKTFQELGERTLGARRAPTRDELVAELDGLRANEPDYIDMLTPLPPTPGLCAACATAHRVEVDKRIAYAAHTARMRAIEHQLFRLSCGGPDEVDEAGAVLADLRTELNRLAGQHDVRCQHWERGVEHDRKGRPVRAWSTVEGLNEATRDLGAIRTAAAELIHRTTSEILAGVPELRQRAAAIMARPLERDVPLAGGLSAPPRLPAGSEAERAGLVPGSRPGILSGTVKIGRRDS